MKNEVALTFEKVRYDAETSLHLITAITAPKIDWQAKRPPICVLPSVDTSGSMDGDKLLNAKKAVIKLFDHLQPGDYAGLVEFNQSAQLSHPVIAITAASKESLKAKVGNLRAGGSTDFAGGMTVALQAIQKADLPDNVSSRVVMFTDGGANVGFATKTTDLVKLLKSSRGKSSVSSFGYGSDADSELMASISKEGEGNYAFIKNPEDALSAFAKELGGLLSVYAKNIVVTVSTHGDHKLTDVLTDADVEEDKEVVRVKLGDILSEETRNIVAAFKLAKQAQAFPRNVTVADVIVDYDTLGVDGKIEHHTENLKAKVRFVKEGEQQTKATAELDGIVGLAQIVKTQIDAEEAAKRGDYSRAHTYFSDLSGSLQSRGLNYLSVASAGIGSSYASNSVYMSTNALRSSISSGIGRGTRSFTTDETAKGLMKSMNISGSNAVMESMDASFHAEEPAVATSVFGLTIPPIEPKVSLSKSKARR